MDHDLTLKAAALKLGFVTEAEFDRVVDPGQDGPTLRRNRRNNEPEKHYEHAQLLHKPSGCCPCRRGHHERHLAVILKELDPSLKIEITKSLAARHRKVPTLGTMPALAMRRFVN
jgi:hypothetical protein